MNEFKPVAWLLMDGTIISEYSYNLRKLKEDGDIPLFTQRTWVGLTTDDWDEIRKQVKFNFEMTTGEYAERVSHLVEDKLREKNT